MELAGLRKWRISYYWLVCSVLLVEVSLSLVIFGKPPTNQALLRSAEVHFSQKQFVAAAQYYQLFVQQHPESPEIQKAWYQLGESYRRSNQLKRAQETFAGLIRRFRQGHQVGAAAYQLGAINFDANQYSAAVSNFELASRTAESERVRYQALYFNARGLQLIKKDDLAIKVYRLLLRSHPGPETRLYYEQSKLHVARLHLNRGEELSARQYFQELADSAEIKTIREEAIFRSGMAALESGDIDAGERRFNSVANFPPESPWRALAEVGAIFVAHARGNSAQVVAVYESGAVINTSEEFRAQVLLSVAEAYRKEGNAESADRLYALVSGRYRTSSEGVKAGYRRLTALYKSLDTKLPAAANEFTTTIRRQQPDNPMLDRAYLMLAEWHFFLGEKIARAGDRKPAIVQYELATRAFESIRLDKITPALRPALLHHAAWSFLEIDDIGRGGLAVEELLRRFPENPILPTAMAKRGETFLRLNDLHSAKLDFLAIVRDYPQSPSVEIALERLGRIYAHNRDAEKTIQYYTQLLEQFGETSSRAEASFWIGVSYFDQGQFEDSIPFLEAAATLAPDSYKNRSRIRIITAYHHLDQIPKLEQSCRIYIGSNLDAGVSNAEQKKDKPVDIPSHILVSLARSLSERNRYQKALYFLELVSDPQKPVMTLPKVWKQLGDTRLKTDQYDRAIEAYDLYLVRSKDRHTRGAAYLSRGQAQYALKKYQQAKESAYMSIRVLKQGRINAEARILVGDIASVEGDPQAAAREYLLVSQIFRDPNITPRALQKSIVAYRQLGDQDKVDQLQERLKQALRR